MQNKGAITFLAIIIGLACAYQLSFTWATQHQENNARDYAQQAVEQFQTTPAFAAVSELDRAFFIDSMSREKERYYLDSITAEKVFLSFTYKEVKDKEINLGLDLKGGMNVMLEVSMEDLIRALADYSPSSTLQSALALAKENQLASRSDLITLFGEAWNTVAPGQRLSQIFGTYDMRDRIKPESTNDEVIKVIRGEAESAIANSFNVLRNRIDRFGVTQPNIQRSGNSGRILVELPGVKEPERVRKLLQGTASLEFWETFDNSEIIPSLEEANALIRQMIGEMDPSEQVADEPVAKEQPKELTDEELLEQLTQEDNASLEISSFEKQNPLFAILSPSVYQGQVMPGPKFGIAHYRDTAKVGAWFRMPQILSLFPQGFAPMWSVKPAHDDPNGVHYELYAIKQTTRDGRAPLDGGVVTDARKSFANNSASPVVSMSMNAEGARTWARLTADNINKCIAIVLDGMVYSAPVVHGEITGGSSQIQGNFTVTEADDLANVLKSGKLPAPARIVQEAVVGPSLGSESINAGLVSFAIAFLLVLLYMMFFYNRAGVVANVALLCNVLFLFGALASFGAVLTLPGIAGIVLTMGMAVDANVIIYERIREEIRAGKGLRLAIADGYRNAYSAIIDGNLTTIITGLVLMFFGSGPVQGFATTLVVGIITSMLTSIFITRLIFEWRLKVGKNISFDNKITENFLKNTKIDFVHLRKYAYIISVSVVVISVAFMFTKGFSYGVDFTGGRTYVIRFDKDVSANVVRSALYDEFEESVEVKQFGGQSQMKITTKYLISTDDPETDLLIVEKLFNALKGLFAAEMTLSEFVSTLENPNGIISSEKVGPTIANDIKRDAFIAVFISLIAIFLYIAARFRNWGWGTGGVFSLAHNAIITMGFFSIFSGVLPFSLDVDQTFIAAILTIIGYTINDNVVIFDRIREYRTLFPKRELRININEALNSTLSRTFNTGASTLVVLIAISIFGGEVIRGFSVALIVGVIVGAYSSVFVGTPIVYDMNVRKTKKLQEAGKK
ncbi:MAG: protein translocase subunit SecDF [Prevotellaceae bacterium]|jgi:SecD/SecF fusion protein|nr:protein translocase subunit SecDF [Prevotellaceae bacterium]